MSDLPSLQNLKNISSDITKLGCSIGGLCIFIYLIISDALGAHKKRAHWIPGNAFILSALTIQVLSQLDTRSVSISDKPNIREVVMLLGNHLVIDNERLIICIFMGYLLPGMARPGSGGDWGDIFALAISLISDIVSELYYLHKSKYLFHFFRTTKKVDYNYVYDIIEELYQQPSMRTWYIASSVGIFVSVIFLLLFLGCTIVAGNTIRRILAHRIAAALSKEEIEKSGEAFEDEVLKSWVVARACRPEYVIARSVLSSAAGTVVTLRIVLSLLKLKFLRYRKIVQYDDGLDYLRQANFLLQCVFIFIGWIAICYRWIAALVYFPRSNNIRRFFLVEDFWTRRIKELRYGWQNHIADLKEEMSTAETCYNKFLLGVQVCFLTLAQMFLIGFLMALQTLVVLFGKVCWFLSGIVIGNSFVRRCLVRSSGDHNHSTEVQKYNDVLERVRMPEETADHLRIANHISINQTKKRMDEGMQKAKNCQDLISCISEGYVNQPEFESLTIVKEYFPSLDKMCWKMTAVSYFKVIVRLFPERVERGKKLIDQAGDIMSFLDSADIQENEMSVLNSLGVEADKMGKVADQEFRKAQKSPHGNIRTAAEAREEIRKLLQPAEQVLKDKGLIGKAGKVELQDSRNLKKIAPSYSLYRVCKHILKTNGDSVGELKNLRGMIEDQFRNFVGYCVLQGRAQLVKKCREWAKDFEEDKIWETVSIAGKVKGVLENSEPQLNLSSGAQEH